MVNNVKASVDYSKGKIYKIVSDQIDKIYIGSTTKKYLSQRMDKHRTDYKRWKNNNTSHYLTSFEILKFDDAKIVLIENYPCADIDELHSRERFHIENNDCVNKVIPTRTNKEYISQNKDRLKELVKEYRKQNKEKIKEQVKEYREQNKDKIKEQVKEYRKKNKDKIKEQTSAKFDCECGGCYTQGSKARHRKSLKHTKYLSAI